MIHFDPNFGSFGDWAIILGLVTSVVLLFLYRWVRSRNHDHLHRMMSIELPMIQYQNAVTTQQYEAEYAALNAVRDGYVTQRDTRVSLNGRIARLWRDIQPLQWEENESRRWMTEWASHYRNLRLLSQRLIAQSFLHRLDELHEGIRSLRTMIGHEPSSSILYRDTAGKQFSIPLELARDYNQLETTLNSYYAHERPLGYELFLGYNYCLHASQGDSRTTLTGGSEIAARMVIETSILVRYSQDFNTCPVCSSCAATEVCTDWIQCGSCAVERRYIEDDSMLEMAYPEEALLGDLKDIRLITIVAPTTDSSNSSIGRPISSDGSYDGIPEMLGSRGQFAVGYEVFDEETDGSLQEEDRDHRSLRISEEQENRKDSSADSMVLLDAPLHSYTTSVKRGSLTRRRNGARNDADIGFGLRKKTAKQLLEEAVGNLAPQVAYDTAQKNRESDNQAGWESTASLVLPNKQTVSRTGEWATSIDGAEQSAARALRDALYGKHTDRAVKSFRRRLSGRWVRD